MTFDLKTPVSKTLLGLAGVALAVSLGIGASAQQQPSSQPKSAAPKTTARPKAAPARGGARPSATQPGCGPGPVVLPYSERVWAQTNSDITPDPNIRFGTLPNGMRYAIMKNATPPGQASFRLVMQTGSLVEHDDQQGLAHFLEHMAFKGSTHVGENDMIKILERLGLQFGADTNASTGQTETVYQFDLPHSDETTIDTALMLFRETGSELTISQAAMDRERGVILSEERSRDTPDYRLYKAEEGFVLQDHIATRRYPIGLVDVVRNAPATTIQQYYREHYRPDHAILVAVGDFDVNALEQKIKDKFTDWKPQTAAPAGEAALTLPSRRGPGAKVAIEPGGQLDVSIDWVLPPDLSPDTKAKQTRELIEQLGINVLNRRLDRMAHGPNPPFIRAGLWSGDMYHSAKRIDLDVTGHPDGWRQALNAAIIEQRKLVDFGVTRAELDREITAMRTGLAATAAQAPTRRTPELANEIAGSIDEPSVVTNPDQDLAMFNDAVTQVTVDKVNAAIKADFTGSGPLAFIGTPTPIDGGDATVLAALNQAMAAPITADAALAVKPWTYTNFGTPGKVAEQHDEIDLGTTFVRFENGVNLTVKPTKFKRDSISISIRVGAGRLNLPTDRTTPDWAFSSAYIGGGLKDLTQEEISQIMNDKIVGVNAGIDDNAIAFGGGTRPADLNTEMQLIAAYVTAPGWRPEAFERVKSAVMTARDQQDATDEGVLGRELSPLLRSGDKRWAFSSQDEIASSTLNQVRALADNDLANGPIDIVMVGDTTVDKAIAAVAATFGALPPRPSSAWTRPPAPVVRFPAANSQPVVLTHKGRADQSYGFIAWKADDFFADTRKARATRILGDILTIRMTEELRQKRGATYSPEAGTSASSVFPGFGMVEAEEETPPQNLPAFFSTVEAIAADLRDNPVSDDLLTRAKAPEIEATQRSFDSSNDFWLGQLTDAQKDPRHLAALRSALADLRSISAAEIQAAARAYLTPDREYKVIVKAASAPAQ